MSGESPPDESAETGKGVSIGDVDGGIHESTIAGRDIHIHKGEDAFDVRGLLNPYLGLRAFTYDERGRYAGREREVAEAVKLLTAPGQQRVLLIITGASGSGKSSLAQAGLLPALEIYYCQQNRTVRRAVMRPARQPLATLAHALLQLGLSAEGSFQAAGTFAFGAPAQSAGPDQISLLVIDQFEELFTQSETDQRKSLLALLASLPSFAELRMHIIVSLRVDYLPDLFAEQTLYELATRGIELRAMSVEELKTAIQRPLQDEYPTGDRRFEDALLDKLAHDAAGDETYLPLLQVTLEDLWRGGTLKLSEYGNLADAIQQRAMQVYTNTQNADGQPVKRTQADQDVIMQIFLDLVDVSLDDDPRRDVRHRRLKSDLKKHDAQRSLLIDDLIAARLLSVSTDENGQGAVDKIDIIHDSLIANWKELQKAIKVRRELLKQRVRFEYALGEWLGKDRAAAYLLDGIYLTAAESLDKAGDIALTNSEAQQLLASSIDRRRRRNHLRRIGIVAIAIVVVLIVAGSGYMVYGEWVSRETATPLIPIDGGRATIGAPSGELAERTVALLPFQIEQFEVSNRQYRACVKFGPCEPYDFPDFLEDEALATYPVVQVSARDARTYCTWLGRRLPTTVEWEHATRGLARLWPWGNDLLPSPDFDFSDMPLPVNSLSITATPEGIYHLADNVSEWVVRVSAHCEEVECHQAWDGETDTIAYMGGAYDRPIHHVAQVKGASPESPDPSIGFRCVVGS